MKRAFFPMLFFPVSPAFAVSSDDQTTYLVLGGIGIVLGIFFFFMGFAKLRLKRMIEDIPTSTVRAMAPGQVEVVGKPVEWNVMEAPFTQKPCVYYDYDVEEERTRTVGTGKDRRTETYWASIQSDNTSEKPFFLEDGTGKLFVKPEGADIIMRDSYSFISYGSRDVPSQAQSFLRGKGLDCSRYGKLRFTEHKFEIGEELYAMGVCQKSFAQKGAPAGAVEDYCLGKGIHKEVFILSDKSQKGLQSSLGWQAFFGVFGGLALIGGGTYALNLVLGIF